MRVRHFIPYVLATLLIGGGLFLIFEAQATLHDTLTLTREHADLSTISRGAADKAATSQETPTMTTTSRARSDSLPQLIDREVDSSRGVAYYGAFMSFAGIVLLIVARRRRNDLSGNR
jgi:predicted DNA repair protein MutK